jgi:hypothetical protein
MDANRYEQNFGSCHLQDKRLDRRAFSIGAALSQYFGQALSTVFKNAKELKRTYEFSLILK